MNVLPSRLPGVLVLEPKVFEDQRGFFFENYNARDFAEKTGINTPFVQDNHTRSARNVLRGLHYQIKQPQGKLVRAIKGEVFDVVVDLHKSAATFGQWTSVILSAANRRMLWIPSGFAHGFLVLSEHADILYKTTDYWAPTHERCITWNDPQLNIAWPLKGAPVLSPKDQNGAPFLAAEVFP
jgi:dTDP-4-dehydrorhamnose 3,5-epimerase